MLINDVFIYMILFFFIIGATDHFLGNRWGVGEKFVEGFKTMGTVALAMLGIVSLAPVLAKVLAPMIVPVFTLIGADPSIFATMLLAIDMGGYALAYELANDPDAGAFAGVLLGTMMGPTIVFTIPVALNMIRKRDQTFFAKGVLIGLMTVPLGCFIGGTIAGFDLRMMLVNLVPITFFALLIALGLKLIPHMMIKGFQIFAKAIELIILLGLGAITIETLTSVILIPGMTPLAEGLRIVGLIAIALAGAFPMVYCLTKVAKKLLDKLNQLLGINHTSSAGLISSLAHVIPMFTLLKDMDDRGKVINAAFAVSGAFVLGGHLGFVAGVQPEMILSMIIGKLSAGITAIILAFWFTASKSKT